MTTTKNPLQTRLTEDFGIEYPVIAFTHCRDVVAAVVNAGGLSVFGAGGRSPDEIAADVEWIRGRVGDKPFGVDLLIPASVPAQASKEELLEQIPQGHLDFIKGVMRDYDIPEAREDATSQRRGTPLTQERYRAQLDALLDLRPAIFASAIGNPAFILEAAHARGIKVMGLIGLVRQAVREHEAGVDYIIAQGQDSAGHTGEVGTFSLVPQVVNAVSPTPVILAGGVGGSGKQLAAALALGAQGVWTGTMWLTSRESDVDIILKEKLLKATERDTVRSRTMTGKPARGIRTTWHEVWDAPDAPQPLPMPLQGMLVADVLTSINQNKVEEFMWSPAGQGVGMVTEYKPAAQILFDMVAEAQEVFEGFYEQP